MLARIGADTAMSRKRSPKKIVTVARQVIGSLTLI
jgi:hypothetical protein